MKPLELFLQDHEGHLKRLNPALKAGSFDEARRLLHTMKGNAEAFGFFNLVKYIHTIEWLVGKIQSGSISWDEGSVGFLENCVLNLQGAFAIYKVDPKNPLTLREKIAEVLSFIRDRISEANQTPSAPQVESIPLQNHEEPPFFLHVVAQGQEARIPCRDIIRVLGKTPLLHVRASDGKVRALARIQGKLVPVRSSRQDERLDAGTSDDTATRLPFSEWLLLMRDPRGADNGDSMDKNFCLPVDEIRGVIQSAEDHLETEEKEEPLPSEAA